MSHSVESIEQQVAGLSVQERAELAVHLIDSIDSHSTNQQVTTEQAWLDEANARYSALLNGQHRGLTHAEVFNSLKSPPA